MDGDGEERERGRDLWGVGGKKREGKERLFDTEDKLRRLPLGHKDEKVL